MDSDNQERSSIPFGGIVAVLLLGLGIIVQQLPLESLRPAGGAAPSARFPYQQDVDARLWQDPFEAVRLHRDQILGSEGAAALEREDRAHVGAVEFSERPTQVLGVMVFGSPYSEAAEARRRTRYAVLAALMNRGLHADNADHIGYLTFNPAGEPITRRLPEVVPYELFVSEDGKSTRLLLFWIDEDSFANFPLDRLSALIGRTGSAGLPVKIIGPSGSDILAGVIGQLCEKKPGAGPPAGNAPPQLQFYVATATAADRFVVPESCGVGTIEEAVKGRGSVKLLRAIASDDILATRLKKELKLRGVRLDDPEQRIAVISELETLYGRVLAEGLKDETQGTDYIHQYSYLRGLDGETARSQGNGPDKPAGDRADGRGERRASGEFAAGSRQLDYLRRLAAQIKADDTALRNEGNRFTAVGVLGSDFYDKQLILQALRRELPDALYFTTDLDARSLDPGQWPIMRNLIAVSGFGLSLRKELQGNTPPFRDSYQTANYLATLLALSDAAAKPAQWTPQLRNDWLTAKVFEIGRTGAFELSTVPDSRADGKCTLEAILQCDTVHPPGSAFFPISGLRMWGYAGLVVAFATLLLLVTAWWFRAMVLATLQSVSIRWQLMAGVTALALPAILIGWAWIEGRDGEPLAWMEGISTWPSYLLRYGAALLCIYFISKARDDGTAALAQTLRRFFPGETFDPPDPTGAKSGAALAARRESRPLRAGIRHAARSAFYSGVLVWPLLRSWHRRVSLYHWAPRPATTGNGDSPVHARELMAEYLALGRPRNCIVRVAIAVLAYLGVAFALILFFGKPATPYRGAANVAAHWATLIPTVVLFVILLLWVVDATRRFQRLVEHLMRTDTVYPPATIGQFSAQLNVPAAVVDKYLDEWIDIQLIADSSRYVSRLVYYPFIIIALLLLARSPLIDNWHTPLGLGLVVILGFSYAGFCALNLRSKAEEARNLAIVRMTRHILHARGDPALGPAVIDQLEMLLDEIRKIRRGAFRPLSQQPVFKAALVPLGSYGMIETAQYLLFAMR